MLLCFFFYDETIECWSQLSIDHIHIKIECWHEEREERFLQLLQSIQPQAKAATAVEGKSDLFPELMREITQFSYDPESGTTFTKWMGALKLCWVTTECSTWRPTTRELRVAYLTKRVLKDMLGDKISVFRRRIDVMRLAIGNLTFRKLRSTINRMVALAQFDSLTKENFKCLIYILRCKEPNTQTLEPDCYQSLRNKKGACWRTWSNNTT